MFIPKMVAKWPTWHRGMNHEPMTDRWFGIAVLAILAAAMALMAWLATNASSVPAQYPFWLMP